MSEKTASDTASDSDFDENDLSAEEEEEDSIGPDEDVADEEEINSLVKESEMSLEDLLASYGVPKSEFTNRPSTSQPSTSGSTRTSRLRSARLASGPTVFQVEEKATNQESKLSTDSAPINHNRKANTSGSLSPEEPNAHPSTSSSVNCLSPVLSNEVSNADSNSASLSDSQTDTRQTTSSSITTLAGQKRRRASSLPLPADEDAALPSSVAAKSAADSSESSQSPSTSAHQTDSETAHTQQRVEQTNDFFPRPDELTKETDIENRESDQDDEFSRMFWKKAIQDGESPPSYNSEDDEDYAPSEESGPDWRGEIRVGDEYQACVPADVSESQSTASSDWWDTRRFENESSRLWQPDKISEAEVVHFERLFAQSMMGPLPNDRTVDDEEALFLLMRCNYDPDEALQRLRFRTVIPSEIPGYLDTWSEADATAFEKGFALYNKDFRQIRETRLRHKTVGELVHYYYLWKKTARHDEFARVYRRDKRKSPHPSITDFMDYLVLEQESAAESYPYAMNGDHFRLHNHHLARCPLHKTLSGSVPHHSVDRIPAESEGKTSDR